MSEKRRDNKGRILRQGELQRSDGKYEYRYFDVKGEKRSIYSWKLVSTDKVPKGKRECRALRDMVKEIRRDVEDGINSYQAYRTSLNRFFDDYIETKYELKPSTRTNYKYMYNKYVREEIGYKDIASIKFSDIKKWYSVRLLANREENNRVALSLSILRTYFSPCWKWKKCMDDCKEKVTRLGLGHPRGDPALFDGERKVSHERPEQDKPP